MDYLYGDTDGSLVGKQTGGDDVMKATLEELYLVGDASFMTGISTGGDDWIIGYQHSNYSNGAWLTNVLIGDAVTMTGDSTGGADSIRGGLYADSAIFGDAFSMQGYSHGGNDHLQGGFHSSTNYLYGDAYSMDHASVGGNDSIEGAPRAAVNYLYGDAYVGSAEARGGNDMLFSQEGTDHMWGDFAVFDGNTTSQSHCGNDVFVFAMESGTDYVYDFHHGEDKINLRDKLIYNVTDFSTTVDGGNLVLAFNNNGDSITLIGISSVDETDFIFASP